jgi:hypothetical protein
MPTRDREVRRSYTHADERVLGIRISIYLHAYHPKSAAIFDSALVAHIVRSLRLCPAGGTQGETGRAVHIIHCGAVTACCVPGAERHAKRPQHDWLRCWRASRTPAGDGGRHRECWRLCRPRPGRCGQPLARRRIKGPVGLETGAGSRSGFLLSCLGWRALRAAGNRWWSLNQKTGRGGSRCVYQIQPIGICTGRRGDSRMVRSRRASARDQRNRAIVLSPEL